MNKGSLYLSGPLENCTIEEAYGWRERIRELIGSAYVIIPVSLKKEYPTELDGIKLVEKDLNDIRSSVGVLCNMWKIGLGSSQELVYASGWGKPTVVVVPKGSFCSPWLKYHSTAVVEGTIEEGLDRLKQILRWEE